MRFLGPFALILEDHNHIFFFKNLAFWDQRSCSFNSVKKQMQPLITTLNSFSLVKITCLKILEMQFLFLKYLFCFYHSLTHSKDFWALGYDLDWLGWVDLTWEDWVAWVWVSKPRYGFQSVCAFAIVLLNSSFPHSWYFILLKLPSPTLFLSYLNKFLHCLQKNNTSKICKQFHPIWHQVKVF